MLQLTSISGPAKLARALRRSVTPIIGIALLLALSACTRIEEWREPPTPAPEGSLLAEIHRGMSMGDVRSILGTPTSERKYATGKAWIPFYAGRDIVRTELYYAAVGRVILSTGGYGDWKVTRVEYDPILHKPSSESPL